MRINRPFFVYKNCKFSKIVSVQQWTMKFKNFLQAELAYLFQYTIRYGHVVC